MRKLLLLTLARGAVAAFGVAVGAGGAKPKPSVTYAKSWDAAVDEARLLNLPMVVHSHGFY